VIFKFRDYYYISVCVIFSIIIQIFWRYDKKWIISSLMKWLYYTKRKLDMLNDNLCAALQTKYLLQIFGISSLLITIDIRRYSLSNLSRLNICYIRLGHFHIVTISYVIFCIMQELYSIRISVDQSTINKSCILRISMHRLKYLYQCPWLNYF